MFPPSTINSTTINQLEPPEFPADPAKSAPATLPADHLLWSDDPGIWRRLG